MRVPEFRSDNSAPAQTGEEEQRPQSREVAAEQRPSDADEHGDESQEDEFIGPFAVGPAETATSRPMPGAFPGWILPGDGIAVDVTRPQGLWELCCCLWPSLCRSIRRLLIGSIWELSALENRHVKERLAKMPSCEPGQLWEAVHEEQVLRWRRRQWASDQIDWKLPDRLKAVLLTGRYVVTGRRIRGDGRSEEQSTIPPETIAIGQLDLRKGKLRCGDSIYEEISVSLAKDVRKWNRQSAPEEMAYNWMLHRAEEAYRRGEVLKKELFIPECRKALGWPEGPERKHVRAGLRAYERLPDYLKHGRGRFPKKANVPE